eukprot:scaffold9832_cov156-Skeletonema_dohrnii-CCMP3373.AAC.2
MPALQRAGVVSAETIVENLINNVDMPFVTDNTAGLEDKYFSKEERIDTLIKACRKAYGEDGSAKVEDQVDIIQMYAQNHWLEIQERLGMEAPISWRNLTVKQILSNMGKNGWYARVKKYGLEEVVKQNSERGEKGWNTKLKKKGIEKLLDEMALTRSASVKARQEQADEKQQILDRLAQSGEPFWVMAKKGEITAKIGQPLFRSYRKEVVDNFPRIQERHGTFVSLEKLCYKEIPFGNNKVLDTITYGTIKTYKRTKSALKRYSLMVPYGMLSYPDNGNVVLTWFQEK